MFLLLLNVTGVGFGWFDSFVQLVILIFGTFVLDFGRESACFTCEGLAALLAEMESTSDIIRLMLCRESFIIVIF